MQWKWWYWPGVLYGAWLLFGIVKGSVSNPWTFDYEHFVVVYVCMGVIVWPARWILLVRRYGVAGAREKFWVQRSDPNTRALIMLSLVLAAIALALTWDLSLRSQQG